MFNTLRKPLQFIDGIANRICSVIGAVALSQFPRFFGQYMQRPGGHLDEAKRALEQYIRPAAA
ncbi:MAG TPA: DUF2937 family protein [Firmicutes bacterium]|nr:DUF2937 family protein [Bacillota bacterium]